LPLALHVWTPLPAHCVLFGAQTPWQDAVPPVATQAWLPQSMGLSHAPDALQFWTELPEHCEAPGVQPPPPSEASVVVSSGASEESSTVESGPPSS
jgi:hypothetical protein